jgi:hypothetical protein
MGVRDSEMWRMRVSRQVLSAEDMTRARAVMKQNPAFLAKSPAEPTPPLRSSVVEEPAKDDEDGLLVVSNEEL